MFMWLTQKKMEQQLVLKVDPLKYDIDLNFVNDYQLVDDSGNVFKYGGAGMFFARFSNTNENNRTVIISLMNTKDSTIICEMRCVRTYPAGASKK